MPIMTLHNRDWQNGVNVEARQGSHIVPEQNPSLGTCWLQYNENWVITSGTDDVFYRRDTDPNNPNGNMTEWVDLSNAFGDQVANLG
jgi:hypothetical protein